MESKIELLGEAAGPSLPEIDEADDLVLLLVLSQLPVGVAEDARFRVLGQECQYSLLASASLGDVVLLDQGVLAVEGDGVEVEVERRPPLEAQAIDHVEPVAHQGWIAGRIDPATVFGAEGSLGDDVEAGEEGQPFVEDGTHDMAVAGAAEELQRQQRSQGAAGRDHLRAGEAATSQDRVQIGRDQIRQEQEQTAELCAEVPWRQIELPDVSGVGHGGTRVIGSLLVPPSRQLGKAFFLQDRRDCRRADGLAVAGERAADVVDGQVLLPQSDDPVPQPLLLAGWPTLSCRRHKEVTPGIGAELMDEDPEAPRGVAELSSRLGRRDAVHEEGPQGFVLPVSGVGGLQESARQG